MKQREYNERLIKLQTNNYLQEHLFQMIQPLIFWLEHSIRTRDKITLFKKIWNLLKLIIQKCTSHSSIKIDIIQIIFPHLQKVKDICKENTPSLDMLNFLKFILYDIKPKMVQRNPKLQEFLLDFLLVFCGCMPHNLHDEIF